MWRYVCKDLQSAMQYLPYGIAAGIVCFIVLFFSNLIRKAVHKKKIPTIPWTLFFTYLIVVLMITFLSRESGTQTGLDLELFSTFGINKRNNAYVVENVLLFVPYGILSPLVLSCAESFFGCFLLGTVTSFGVELLQLITGRGYFQIDDILTNAAGSAIGYLLYFLSHRVWKKWQKQMENKTSSPNRSKSRNSQKKKK